MTIPGKKLTAYPMTEDIGYRERTDSLKLNRIMNSMEESVLRAMMRGSEFSEAMARLNLAVTTSYLAMSRRPQVRYRVTNTVYATPFNSVRLVNNQHRGNTLFVDRTFGQLTLGYDKVYYKTPRIDTDGDGILDRVSPNVKVLVDGEERDEDDNVYDALDRRNQTFWIEAMGAGEHTIEIQYPPSVDSKFNYLKLVPFPLYGVEVSGVMYQDVQSNDIPIATQSLGPTEPIKTYLSPKEFNGTIKIHCNVLDDLGVLGFSFVDVGMIDFINGEQTGYIAFDRFRAPPTTSVNIDTVKLDWYVDGFDLSDPPIRDVAVVRSTDAGETEIIDIPNVAPGAANIINKPINNIVNNTLWLRFTIEERNMTTPVIRGAKLRYS